ncbi:MAG: flotillin domain-containing protein [Gammaproteobacteria bacterium]
MAWFITLLILLIAATITLWFLNRYYRKATREIALIRTGYGGKRIALDGGCLALPFLHRITEVNMRTQRLDVRREGPDSLITQDRLRVDISVEFYVRVQADAEGVATAAQALGGKTFRAIELQEVLDGKLIDAIQSAIAQRTLDQLHEDRPELVRQVRTTISDSLARNGLELESVSLTRLDQTPFDALDENNAFNAVGMRRLAEVIAHNKKQRAAIEAEADTAVRQTQLEAAKRRLDIEREEEAAKIEQALTLNSLQAEQDAQLAERRANAEQRSEAARLDKERRLRELALHSKLSVELADKQNQIDLARKSSDVAEAESEAAASRAAAAAAAETIQTERDKAIAERARQIALIRSLEQAEVDELRDQAAATTVRSQAEAAATARRLRAQAEAEARQAELSAEAVGRKALAEADNTLSERAVNLRLQQHKLDRLPELVGQMVKPVEKIDSIRIHQISGLGASGNTHSGSTASGSGNAPVNQAIDGLLGMAVQLPVLQKLGRELGLSFEQGLAGLVDPPESLTPEPLAPESPESGTADSPDTVAKPASKTRRPRPGSG